MFKRVILIGCIFISVPLAGQELPDLSNYQHNWMIFNPGFTGTREALSVSAFFRQKDFSVPGPVYEQLSAHTPLKNENVALGASVFAEQNPGFNKTSAFFNYAYRVWTGGGRLAFGLSGGVTVYSESFQDLDLTNPDDPVFQANEQEYLPNFGAGIVYYTDDYFLGFSVPYFLTRGEERNSMTHDFNHYTAILTGGYMWELSEAFKVKPTFITMVDVGTRSLNYQGSVNLAFFGERLWVGGIYKSSRAVSGIVNIQLSHQVLLGYSYDYYLSNTNSYFNGSHEIVLRWEFRKAVPSRSPIYY